MVSLDRVLVVDADGRVDEGDADISSRLSQARAETTSEGALR